MEFVSVSIDAVRVRSDKGGLFLRKRVFSCLMTVFLLANLLSVGAVAAGTEISVSPPDTLPAVGESFTVTVDLSGNPGVAAAQFTLQFDSAVVDCKQVSTGTVLSGMLSATNPDAADGAIVAAASTSESKKDGTLATYVFTVVGSGDPKFGVADLVLSNAAGNDVICTVKNPAAEKPAQPSPDPAPTTPLPEQPKPAEKPAEEQKPTEKPSAEEKPVQPEQPKPTEKPAEEQKPTEKPSAEEKPDKPEQPKPTEKPAEEQKPAERPSAEEKPVQPEQTVEHRFTDTKGHALESYINSAMDKGLFGGYADGSFRPGNPMTRGAFVTVLWRMSGKPQPTGRTPFADIGAVSDEFRTAITWAYNEGYIGGRTATTFAPGENISRQAAMKILYGFSDTVGEVDPMFMMAFNLQYPDAAKLPSWASVPMYWGVQNGIISGTTDGRLNGGGTATRAQLAKILSIYDEKFNG